MPAWHAACHALLHRGRAEQRRMAYALWLVTSSDATAAGIFTLSLPIPFDSPVIPANRLEPITRHYRADNFQPTSGCSVRRIGASRTASKRRIIQSYYDEDTTDEETNLWHTRH